MNISAPVNEWSIQKASDEIYYVAAYEYGHKCLYIICSVEGEECIKQGVEQLRDHCGSVVSDPQAFLFISESLSAPFPPFVVEPYIRKLGYQIYQQGSADDSRSTAEYGMECSAGPVVLARSIEQPHLGYGDEYQ